jgi:hypothetical protein
MFHKLATNFNIIEEFVEDMKIKNIPMEKYFVFIQGDKEPSFLGVIQKATYPINNFI